MIVGPNFTFFSLFLFTFPPVYYSVLPGSFLLCSNSSWILLLGSLFFSSAPGHHCPLYFLGSFFFFFLGSSRALASPPSHVCSPDLWRVWDSTFYCPLFLGFFLGNVVFWGIRQLGILLCAGTHTVFLSCSIHFWSTCRRFCILGVLSLLGPCSCLFWLFQILSCWCLVWLGVCCFWVLQFGKFFCCLPWLLWFWPRVLLLSFWCC